MRAFSIFWAVECLIRMLSTVNVVIVFEPAVSAQNINLKSLEDALGINGPMYPETGAPTPIVASMIVVPA